MKKIPTELSGVYILEPQVYQDERGSFRETWSEAAMEKLGLSTRWSQDNESVTNCGWLRGLHFQVALPQAKLVRVVCGEVLDVVIDMRVGSLNFGKSVVVELSARNGHILSVPRGFAHGFLSMDDGTKLLYKVGAPYSGPADQHGVRWNDPDLAIRWPVPYIIRAIAKDTALPTLAELLAEPGQPRLPRYEL